LSVALSSSFIYIYEIFHQAPTRRYK